MLKRGDKEVPGGITLLHVHVSVVGKVFCNAVNEQVCSVFGLWWKIA